MYDPARVRRHAERVRELVASVVRTQIKDPRLGMLTITDARITADLRDMGWRVSTNTVAVLMREQGLVARRKRRRRGTTKPDKSARKAPDLLGRDFTPPEAPNVAWVGDLTEIPTDEGKLQLASVEDLHSRRVPGFAMGIHHDAALARAVRTATRPTS